jgi:hypothetical protein
MWTKTITRKHIFGWYDTRLFIHCYRKLLGETYRCKCDHPIKKKFWTHKFDSSSTFTNYVKCKMYFENALIKKNKKTFPCGFCKAGLKQASNHSAIWIRHHDSGGGAFYL